MIGQALDNVVGVFAPRLAARRMAWRNQISTLKAASTTHQMMEKMLGTRQKGGYEAGKVNRLTTSNHGSSHENDLDRAQITNMRYRSWNLYRNNPQARKICRSLASKVIGRGLNPQPQTVLADGAPHVEFRKRARELWAEFVKESDFRGKPGSGGQHFTTQSATALRQIILSGGVFTKFRHLTRRDQNRKRLLLPLQVQLMHADRLDESIDGDNIWNGVELDDDGLIAAFHLLDSDGENSKRTPAAMVRHLFAEEDVDQILGTPWFCASLLTMDSRRDYESSELTAAEMSACVVGGYRRSNGQTAFGLPNPDADFDLTDGDGNKITSLQPGMFVDLGATGELQMLGGTRPNNNAGEFLAHLQRGEAVGMPGIKSSTVTGDYRNSSFSSERSADNDIWPEIEALQDWFTSGFSQPVYEEVINTAVLAGLFDDVAGFSRPDFSERQRNYLSTTWQGPVARSINPKDDAAAARSRIRNGTSSPQIEASIAGRDWRELLQARVEFREYAEKIGVSDDQIDQMLGIDQDDQPAAPAQSEAVQDSFRLSSLAGVN